jgi:hypothetical protein
MYAYKMEVPFIDLLSLKTSLRQFSLGIRPDNMVLFVKPLKKSYVMF